MFVNFINDAFMVVIYIALQKPILSIVYFVEFYLKM